MSNKKHFIFINAFYNGFADKTDCINVDLIETILKKTKIHNFEITNNLNEANILLESCFGNSIKNYKKWDLKIFFSGESWIVDLNNYDIILKSSFTQNNIINFPLCVYYILNNNLMNKVINRPIITKVPSKFCVFCVSNGGSMPRNKMFEVLNTYKKVDSIGKFNNNVGFNINSSYWSEEYINFLKDYKFIICFENSKYDTYVTEKIVNAQIANILPIYWGTNYVKTIFNENSFIYLENENDNNSYLKVLQNVIELDQDDNKYLNFINKNVLNNEYFNNNFSIDKFADNINKLIN